MRDDRLPGNGATETRGDYLRRSYCVCISYTTYAVKIYRISFHGEDLPSIQGNLFSSVWFGWKVSCQEVNQNPENDPFENDLVLM
jgi:hypothetical protein